MKSKANLFIFGSITLILLAIALVAILNKNTPSGTPVDVRARAGTQATLKFTGTVTSVSEAKGTIEVANFQISDTSRSGNPQNLGDWTVTAPADFNLLTVSPGTGVIIGVDASTLSVTSHEVTALTLTAGK
jgi:hypothetical protein